MVIGLPVSANESLCGRFLALVALAEVATEIFFGFLGVLVCLRLSRLYCPRMRGRFRAFQNRGEPAEPETPCHRLMSRLK